MSKKPCITAHNKPFFSTGGQTHNSSSYILSAMGPSWASVKALGGNTMATPIPWNAFEPVEGQFNDRFVTDLVDEARRQELKLSLLWFASWKNGTMEYCPAWVKHDRERFQRCLLKDGTAIHQLSAHSTQNRDADARAFRHLCEVLRDYDGEENTVIAIQIENEPGILGATRRDFSPLGNAAFAETVPQALIDYAKANPSGNLAAHLIAESGNWMTVFGRYGAEACTAYAIAGYIDEIARLGKEILPELFMYLNVWLSGGKLGGGSDLAGLDWPSGGAILENLDIYYATLKYVDTVAPDNYNRTLTRHREVTEGYAHPEKGFPLFVPESSPGSLNASQVFDAVAKFGAIGYHVFGCESYIDENGELREFAQPMFHTNKMLSNAAPLLEKYLGTKHVFSCVQNDAGDSAMALRDFDGKWKAICNFGNTSGSWVSKDFRHSNRFGAKTPDPELGRCMIFQVSENEFYMVGHESRIRFIEREPMDGSISAVLSNTSLEANNTEFISIEEGYFDENGDFCVSMVRSGDEARHGVWLTWDVGVVKVVLD